MDSVALEVEHLFRGEAARITASLSRSFGMRHIDEIEDCVQDALVRALRLWPHHGVPRSPGAWLIEVARNRMLDQLRRRARWTTNAEPPELASVPSEPAVFDGEIEDDRLNLLFACCHPALPPHARLALTLKLGAGLSVSEIARATLAHPAATAQVLVRAKARLRELEVEPRIPSPEELPERLDTVLMVVYLIFNEGYFATEGQDLIRRDLCDEAIRLAELLAANPRTASPRVHALAALLLFQSARLPARVDSAGEMLLLADQDRAQWDSGRIARALAHFRASADGPEITRYHLEAELAACHTLAPSFEQTDWYTVVETYDRLLRLEPTPIVALNHAIALGHARGPVAALEALAPLSIDPRLAAYYPLHAARATFLRQSGDEPRARAALLHALAASPPPSIRRHLERELGGADRT